MSRYLVNLIIAFFVFNIALDLVGFSAASKAKPEEEPEEEAQRECCNLSPVCLVFVPFTAVYSIICFIISYVVLTLFRTLSLFSAFLRFLGLASANETKSAMLWSLAAIRSLSRGKADAK